MVEPRITFDDFQKVDVRTGTIIEVRAFPEVRKPAYKLSIDFGEIGTLKSSAQITELYSEEDLVGRQILAVVNFEPKQIGPFISECLVLGVYNEDEKVVLLSTEQRVKNGSRIC